MKPRPNYAYAERIWPSGIPEGCSPDDLHELNWLLADAEELDIVGLDEVIAQKSAKLASTNSELRIASLFAEAGCQVQMLRDSSGRQTGVSTPDLRCLAPSGVSFQVEVRRLNRRDAGFGALLTKRLSEEPFGFRVSAEPLGARLWESGTDHADRRARDAYASGVVERLIHELRTRSKSGATEGRIVIDESTFVFSAVADGGESFAGGGWFAARFMGGEAHDSYLVKALREKVEQGTKRLAQESALPYVVAFDVLEDDHIPSASVAELAGPAIYDCRAERLQRRASSAELGQMRASGWSALVEPWKLCPATPSQIARTPSARVFFTAPWATGVSGVLLHYHSWWGAQWLPNPFASPHINDPRLARVGLSLDPDVLHLPGSREARR